jgi:hypothetical protein
MFTWHGQIDICQKSSIFYSLGAILQLEFIFSDLYHRGWHLGEMCPLLAIINFLCVTQCYYFSRLLKVHRISDVRQIVIHIDELLVPDPSPFEIEIAIANLKKYKLPGSDRILAELIQAGGGTLWSEIHKLTNSIEGRIA